VTISRVSDECSIRIEIDITAGVEPVAGRLRTGSHPEVPFTGVLELITLIDQARACAGEPAPPTNLRGSA
jgi:hypothetical protein